mmetsp:Transcript_2061/g.4630  ORF Transcript_2061/g.4630 Transcript_2061/m.4630 type:complete len:101 (-) Transcript_2061:613-915(-)
MYVFDASIDETNARDAQMVRVRMCVRKTRKENPLRTGGWGGWDEVCASVSKRQFFFFGRRANYGQRGTYRSKPRERAEPGLAEHSPLVRPAADEQSHTQV